MLRNNICTLIANPMVNVLFTGDMFVVLVVMVVVWLVMLSDSSAEVFVERFSKAVEFI